jgi:hypothetical protein
MGGCDLDLPTHLAPTQRTYSNPTHFVLFPPSQRPKRLLLDPRLLGGTSGKHMVNKLTMINNSKVQADLMQLHGERHRYSIILNINLPARLLQCCVFAASLDQKCRVPKALPICTSCPQLGDSGVTRLQQDYFGSRFLMPQCFHLSFYSSF